MTYAIIRIGGKQYRVSEGERLLVDRVKLDERATFTPDVLFVGGDTDGESVAVTAQVVGHTLGPKIRIGKYRRRTGYRRHTGHRSKLSEIEIQSIGAVQRSRRTTRPKKEAAAVAAEASAEPPAGYGDMTVAQIAEAAGQWTPAQLEAARTYERDHAARKGAIAALEAAIGRTEEEA